MEHVRKIATGKISSRHRVFTSLLLLIVSTSLLAEPLRDRVKGWFDDGDSKPAIGVLNDYKLQLNDLDRRYLLYLPASLKSDQPAPLVLAFHGGGGHAEFMADDNRYGLIRMAERHGVIVAFPNGYSRLPRDRFATWNAGGCCGDARDKQIDDVAFARAIVAAVSQKAAVDVQRVFAAGMSNGGMMAHRLACEAPDVFRAVAAVAGTDATLTCQPSRAVSVLHIHAKDDTHVLFNGGAGKEAFRDRSKVMDFVSVPETIKRWVSRNQCAATPKRVLDVPGAWCDAYTGCASGSQVRLCVTETGGHSWPGADTVRRGKEPASQALDASKVIWAFFEEVSG